MYKIFTGESGYLEMGSGEASGIGIGGVSSLQVTFPRSNETRYNPNIVLVPDEITDALGRFSAFCLEGYPIGIEGLNGIVSPICESSVLDMGTGAGSFLVSLLDNLQVQTDQLLNADAIDISENAVRVAEENISVSARKAPRPVKLRVIKGDYKKEHVGKFDLVYCNPPYLEHGHDIKHYEATLAPNEMIYTDNAIQEYDEVMSTVRSSLTEKGLGVIRIPRVDTNVDKWVAKFPCRRNGVEIVEVQTPGRVGRAILVFSDKYPEPLTSYDFFYNRLARGFIDPPPIGRIYEDRHSVISRITV